MGFGFVCVFVSIALHSQQHFFFGLNCKHDEALPRAELKEREAIMVVNCSSLQLRKLRHENDSK